MYNPLPENSKCQHAELVRIILKATPADKIYLLGATLTNRRTESIFMADTPYRPHVSHYYVLELAGSEHNLNAVQDKIENTCRHFIPVTAIVLYTHQFNTWLMEGHQFALTVTRKALLLHGEMEKDLVIQKKINRETTNETNEATYSQGLNKVIEFVAGADLYRIRGQNKMAAFMLHQASEHALHTILKTTTGLYLNTHNIDKLIRYCCMISNNLHDIFPRNNEKNERLFELLQRAYIGSRYKEDYSICTSDLLVISKRVGRLQQVMQEIYNAGLQKND